MTMLKLWRIMFLIFDPDIFDRSSICKKNFIMYIVIKLNKKERKECTVTTEYEERQGIPRLWLSSNDNSSILILAQGHAASSQNETWLFRLEAKKTWVNAMPWG